jgi:putative flippase GtrA
MVIRKLSKTSIINTYSYFKKNLKYEIIRYLVVGGLSTITDLSILFLLTKYLNIHYIISSIASFIIASFLSYFLCVSWVFKKRRIRNFLNEFFVYALITFFILFISTALIWFFTDFLGVYYLISKIICILITLIINFLLRKYLLH